MIHLHKSAKLSKQDLRNMKKYELLKKYESLMKDAKNSKDDYLFCKGKNPLNLDEKNKIALAKLIVTFKADALKYWNKAQDLKSEYPFISDMIKLKN